MKKSKLIMILALCFIMPVFADEGMWMLNLLKMQKFTEMQRLGLKLNDYDIYNPDGLSLKDAVVQFGSGCTGEVISSRGLVLTNHHCGYRQIQSHSSLDNNYLDNGFWATTNEEELPNPGLTVTFIDKIEEVTEHVNQCLERDNSLDTLGTFFLSPSYLNRIARERVGEGYLKNNPGTVVEIKPFFGGNQYYMFLKKIYTDVRLVGAPPSSIGKFGADSDNWTWPRHTGDFSLFRVYTDPEGNPAPYSEKNVPLKPKRWLTISTKGVKEDDFVMMLGFPGSTNKFYTSWEVAERRDIDNELRIKIREVLQEAMLEEMLNDTEVKIQYASKYSSSTNGYKNAVGTNWAIDLRDFEQVKLDQQNRLVEWSKKNNYTQYIEALNEIERLVKEREEIRYRSRALNESIILGVEFATINTNTAIELANAIDSEDMAGMERLSRQLLLEYHQFADKDYNREVAKRMAKVMIKEYTDLVSEEHQPGYFNYLYTVFDGDQDQFVDYLFENSLFGCESRIKQFIADISGTSNAKLLREDPMLLFAASVREEVFSIGSQLAAFNVPLANARKLFLEGILAMDGPYSHFPDANLTLRLTYGQVKGYQPRDAISYYPITSIEGVMEKEDPENWEFVVPEKLKNLYAGSDFGTYTLPDGSLPVNFIATTHTTGGNSGSPALNARGELVGINFDRNWEGVGGDIQYLPDFQRSIIVDIRYVLFIIEKFAGATHLLSELELMLE